MDFLRVGTNVELNGFNYFDTYEESIGINKDLKNSLFIPSEEISHINKIITLYKRIEIDNFNFYPIWYINGPQKYHTSTLKGIHRI